MKKGIAAILLPMLFILVGCNGPINTAYEVFDDCQRWTAEEMDIFFDCHSKYLDYENSPSIMVGRIKTENTSIFFCVGTDSSAQLYFTPFYTKENAEKGYEYSEFALGRFIKAPDDYTYVVKIDESKLPDILPDGTILTFTREDITEDELFMPEELGELEKK